MSGFNSFNVMNAEDTTSRVGLDIRPGDVLTSRVVNLRYAYFYLGKGSFPMTNGELIKGVHLLLSDRNELRWAPSLEHLVCLSG